MRSSPPYPASLTWRVAMFRLLVLNQIGALVGALSLYGITILQSPQRPDVSLLYHWMWLECVGMVSWLITGQTMLAVVRGGWRRMAPAQHPHSQMALHQRLPTSTKWLLVATTLGGVLSSTWLAHELFLSILGSDWGRAHLEQTRPPLTLTLFNTSYGTLMIYVLAYFLERAKLAEMRERLAQQLTNEARLNLLRSQLDPHMLFNTLSNLYELIDSSPDQARSMLLRLNSFLRATLQGSQTTQHALHEEFSLAADYLSLMQVRLGDRLRAQVDLPEALRQMTVPAMLLQPLIENAIKHGIEPLKQGGELRLSAQALEGQLWLSVSNTTGHRAPGGDKWQLAKPRDGGGFGLQYVKDRLLAMYGDRARFSMKQDSDTGVTQVSVMLPLVPCNTPRA